jgi:hypothetical protein
MRLGCGLSDPRRPWQLGAEFPGAWSVVKAMQSNKQPPAGWA